MTAWFSWWSHGHGGEDPFSLACLRLAVFYARRWFGRVCLATNGASLPKIAPWFDVVWTGLDAIGREWAPVWALAKLYTYRHAARCGPFLHLDHDFFLRADLPPRLRGRPRLASHQECLSSGAYDLAWFRRACPQPGRLAQPLSQAINCGMAGGKDVDFWIRYAEDAIALIEARANRAFWLCPRRRYEYWRLSAMAEQALLGAWAKDYPFDFFWPMGPPGPGGLHEHLMGRKHDPDTRARILLEVSDLTCA